MSQSTALVLDEFSTRGLDFFPELPAWQNDCPPKTRRNIQYTVIDLDTSRELKRDNVPAEVHSVLEHRNVIIKMPLFHDSDLPTVLGICKVLKKASKRENVFQLDLDLDRLPLHPLVTNSHPGWDNAVHYAGIPSRNGWVFRSEQNMRSLREHTASIRKLLPGCVITLWYEAGHFDSASQQFPFLEQEISKMNTEAVFVNGGFGVKRIEGRFKYEIGRGEKQLEYEIPCGYVEDDGVKKWCRFGFEGFCENEDGRC